MKLGAGHPMGPLALLDLVGLDVSMAIGETIGEPVPERLQRAHRRGRAGAQERPRTARLLSLEAPAALAVSQHSATPNRTFSCGSSSVEILVHATS